MTKLYLTLLICGLSSGVVLGQDCSASTAFEIFHGNEIRTIVSNGGDLFWDLEENTFQVPFTGSETPNMIFAGGIWLGGMDPGGNLKLAAQQYRYNERNDYAPGPLSALGQTDSETCDVWDRIWKVVRHDVQRHMQDYAIDQVIDQRLASIYSWPGAGNEFFTEFNGFELPGTEHLSAPFFDKNDNGMYEPDFGEYPLPEQVDSSVIPMVMTWSVFNDAAAVHTNSLGNPIKAEVQLTTYAFSCDGSSKLDQTLFTSYRIVNRAQEAIDSLIFGQWLDPDLGCHVDDYIGSYPEGNSVFVYNQDPVDGEVGTACPAGVRSYGEHPPILSVTYLNRDLTSSMVYHSGGLWGGPAAMIEPHLPIEFYNYLNGQWRDGTPLSRGGLGYNLPPEDITQFAFDDNPNDPEGWSMYNVDLHTDTRLVASALLGRLESGGSISVDLALTYHLDTTLFHIENVEPMYENVQQLLVEYSEGFAGSCTFEQIICGDDCVYPGDADHNGKVTTHDFLSIAVAQTDTGSTRSGPVAWLPHTVPAWEDFNVDAVNSKHADSDGNGVVELHDLAIADMNYGLTNPYYTPDVNTDFGDEIWVLPEADMMEVGEAFFRVAVEFENPGIDSLYGLAYTLNYDPTYFSTAIPQNHNSLIEGQDVYHDLKQGSGRFESITVATDLNNREVGSGLLLNIVLFGDDDVQISGGSDTTYFSVTDVRAVLNNGSIIEILGQRSSVVVLDETSSVSVLSEKELRIFPNPSSGEITIASEDGTVALMYRVYTLDGRLVNTGSVDNGQASLDLNEGMYFIHVVGGNKAYQTKVMVRK